MKEGVVRLAAALTGAAALPPELALAIERLEASAWPELASRWSRLTPGGFPVEFTVSRCGAPLRWTTEIAGPELADKSRLGCAASILAAARQPIPRALVDGLRELHSRAPRLRFGAWIGGRADGGLKLYAEIPDGAPLRLPFSEPLVTFRGPKGTVPRMIGIEPARDRIELYMRLPPAARGDLLPILARMGKAWAFAALGQALPDGVRRLCGRRLGMSLATSGTGTLDVALFASARTLFPTDPGILRELVPALSPIAPPCRLGMVTLGLHEAAGSDVRTRTVTSSVGVAPFDDSATRHSGSEP